MSYLSIDIGGTYIKYGLLTDKGVIETNWKIKTPRTLSAFKSENKKEIERCLPDIKGIAMSCPGKVDSKSGYVHTSGSVSYLYDFDMSKWIRSITLLPFSVINDGKAAVLAEWRLGNLKGTQNSVAIILGTGVGGGLIINDALYQGSHFQAGELSFIIEEKTEAHLNIYGASGSAVNFIHQATNLIGVDKEDYQSVFEMIASEKQDNLTTLFQNYCRSIAKLMMNLQAILDSEKIVIGGAISKQPILISGIKEAYANLFQEIPILNKTLTPVEIEACYYRNSSNLVGALQQLFDTMSLEKS